MNREDILKIPFQKSNLHEIHFRNVCSSARVTAWEQNIRKILQNIFIADTNCHKTHVTYSQVQTDNSVASCSFTLQAGKNVPDSFNTEQQFD